MSWHIMAVHGNGFLRVVGKQGTRLIGRGRARNILLVLASHEPAHLEGIARYAHEADWTLSRWKPGDANVRALSMHGGILCHIGRGMSELESVVRSQSLPTVSLTDDGVLAGVPAVVPDRQDEGRMAAEHLLARGFRHLVFLGDPENSRRYTGFSDHAKTCGCTAVTVDCSSPEMVRNACGSRDCCGEILDECSAQRRKWAGMFFAKETAFLTKDSRPVGVFCEDKVWGHAVVEGCAEADIPVPEAVAVVSAANDAKVGVSWRVPTTVVVPDVELQAYRAAALLERIMNGERVPEGARELIPPKPIVARASTLALAVADLHVAHAVSFIMRSYHLQSLSAGQVVQASGVSKTVLCRDFAKAMGMTVVQYVQQLRLEEARRMLEQKADPVTTIAEQCGFSGLRHLSRVLKEATGMSPRAYRAGQRSNRQ